MPRISRRANSSSYEPPKSISRSRSRSRRKRRHEEGDEYNSSYRYIYYKILMLLYCIYRDNNITLTFYYFKILSDKPT